MAARRSNKTPSELLTLAAGGEWLTVSQLRAVLDWKNLPCHENTVRGWIRDGKIAVTRADSGHVRVSGREVLAILKWQGADLTQSDTKPVDVPTSNSPSQP